ncbi:MAG: C-GCAxxG-C-C family protein [Acutalibacteraceae bacterium]|nr:C-GCAxxG-C-C family protein [Acutalibacteraceae bacterium]
MELDSKMSYIKKANELFEQKYHCSQAVLGAFAKDLGITEKQALKLGACFGGGMCKGEVCGACAGALMVLGLKYGQCEVEDVASRLKTNSITEKFLDLFKYENGSYLCKELLGCDLATKDGKEYARKHKLFTEFCPNMVASAVKITEQLLNE